MIGRSPLCYIPSFVEISQPVPEKKIFEGFLPYMGMAAILVMRPASVHQIFISLYLKAFIQSLVLIGTVVLRKSSLNFCMYTTLGQGQEMTLTFNTHISSYNNSIRCLLLLTFRSLAATVSEKINCFHFFI